HSPPALSIRASHVAKAQSANKRATTVALRQILMSIPPDGTTYSPPGWIREPASERGSQGEVAPATRRSNSSPLSRSDGLKNFSRPLKIPSAAYRRNHGSFKSSSSSG